jgi:hypothetical protein
LQFIGDEMKTAMELKAEYDFFITTIPNYLDKLKKLMGLPIFTYSFDEIDSVKDFYETNYQAPGKLGVSYDELVYLFYAYVGEVFISRHGGNWELSKMKNDEAYGTPIILNWGNDGKPHARISPWVWKTRIERGNFRGPLSEVIQ